MVDWEGLAASLGCVDDERVEAARLLAAAHGAGQARWPSLAPLPPADFVGHLAAHVSAERRLDDLRALKADDFYLACACLSALPGAVEAFDAELLSRVSSFIGHIDRSPAFADEIRQILRERLLVRRDGARPRIAEYSGHGALGSWLRVAAVRVALDQRMSPHEARRVDDCAVIDELVEESSPELRVLRARYAGALADALRRAVTALTPEQRLILRMYFGLEQSTGHIAVALNIDRSTAARRLMAARQAVFDETRRLLQAELALDSDEFASLARALHDQLNVSLTGLLAEPPPAE
jgi:RNA polymerase sigma-70 factor (ECF subfamily)